jgi:hypothetical protein
MMRKVGNPSLKPKPKTEAYRQALLVTTRVPGRHRPRIIKQLKCQSLQCGTAVRIELILPAPRRFIAFTVRQSSAVSDLGDGGDPRQQPKSRLFP